jgi:hypothetical protein
MVPLAEVSNLLIGDVDVGPPLRFHGNWPSSNGTYSNPGLPRVPINWTYRRRILKTVGRLCAAFGGVNPPLRDPAIINRQFSSQPFFREFEGAEDKALWLVTSGGGVDQ